MTTRGYNQRMAGEFSQIGELTMERLASVTGFSGDTRQDDIGCQERALKLADDFEPFYRQRGPIRKAWVTGLVNEKFLMFLISLL